MMVSNLLNFPTWDQWDRISKCLISDFETTNGQPMVPGRERGWHWRWGAPHPLQGRTIAWEGHQLSTEISWPNCEMIWPYFEGTQFWKYASTMLWRYPIVKWFDPIWPNRYMCFSCVFFHTEGLLFVSLCHGGVPRQVPRQGGSCWARQVQVGSGYHDFDEYFLSAIEAQRKTVPPIAGELSFKKIMTNLLTHFFERLLIWFLGL